MVSSGFSGAPGRSKPRRSNGCNTCRLRKIKCDEQRPACARCKKGNRECPGYEKPVLFVNIGTRRPESCSNANSNTTLISIASGSGTESIGSSLHLGGFRNEVVISHLISKMSIVPDSNWEREKDAPTLFAVLTSHDNESVGYLSGLSVAEALFARIHKIDHMAEHSAQLYARAIQGLRSNLRLIRSDRAKSRPYISLWSTVLLGMYELVSSNTFSNWLQHTRGVAALMELLGPQSFQSPGAHSTFALYRSSIVIGCIIDRKRCFLERIEWKTIPWATREACKSVGDFMRDVLCDIPGIAEDIAATESSSTQDNDTSRARETIQQHIIDIMHKTEQLRREWGARYPNAYKETYPDPKTSMSYDANGQSLFKTVLNFEHADRAVEMVYFDAIQILLYKLLDQVGTPGSLSADDQNYRLQQSDREFHALEICRTVDYFVQDAQGSRGAMTLLFPMNVALPYLKHLPQVSAWVRQVLDGIARSKGWGSAGNPGRSQADNSGKKTEG